MAGDLGGGLLITQASPTQEIPKLPEGTSPIVMAIVYGAVAVVALVGFLGTFIGGRRKPDKPAEAPASDKAGALPASGPVATQAEASQQLMERLVAGLEKRLDDALATQREIQRNYDAEVDDLRAQLSAEQQAKWRLTSEMQSLQRQLEEARTEVIQLRAQLQATRPQQQRGQW